MNKKVICGYIISLLTIIMGVAVMAYSYITANQKVYLFNDAELGLSEYGLWMSASFLIVGVVDFFLNSILFKDSERLTDKFIQNNRGLIIASIIFDFVSFDLNITCSVNVCILPKTYNLSGIEKIDILTIVLAIIWLYSAVIINVIKLLTNLNILKRTKKYACKNE